MTGNQAKTSTKKVFGERKEPPVLIIARGEKISHFTLRPWMTVLGGAAFLALSAAYLGATAYLVLRDDLMSAGIARHARNQQLYEDRISALRTEVDRITSRQMLDQQVMENKVAELMQRQQTLSARDGKLAPLLERASQLQPMPDMPTETAPDVEQHSQYIPNEALAGRDFPGIDPIITGPVPGKSPTGKPDRRADARSVGLRLSGGLSGESTLETSDKILATINQNLHRIESEQNGKVRVLADAAYEKADSILDTLNAAGLRIETPGSESVAMGGPLIPVSSPGAVVNDFDMQLRNLDSALDRLDQVRKRVSALPLANPAPGKAVTSLFGVRRDPFLGTAAFHSGIDFRASYGQTVKSTAAGKIVKAGRFGGYGNMVEIDHGNGFSTRFAHLSRVLVRDGQQIAAGVAVGEAGSSGRSTGSHLHYEVRENGRAVNPVNFLKAGKQIEPLL
ncbi:murein DD-endopeptidase MepM/ murein hydrolase activator NlpD [Ochrobactrum sp. J50]|uniref:M23 family metallopeptidase n=1 Tax=Brucella/Ochrobactrum group TaxID=2826938 RepID=UPI0011A3A97F|nr:MULTISPECIES: M23 family metallopeptidase [Brucella/Ochrobactrum group]MCO7725838.1 M23 family metallopeptidase [Brucella intermedia]TWG95775.1 murein DD-endopeptidase MepM/ murein hydrolase activator NlpD [Ochrobactrum sp. J50]WPM81232.1 M23 family metallopeptidase [Brucella pseudintermedia]